MGHRHEFYCDMCEKHVDDQGELAHITLGGEYEGEVCEECFSQVWARARPVLMGENVLKSVG